MLIWKNGNYPEICFGAESAAVIEAVTPQQALGKLWREE